jgi:threonine dehydrogenase-like Zn-dependent dehydrogenase
VTAGARERVVDRAIARGEIGGRTVQIVETGAVEMTTYPVPSPAEGKVRVRTTRSAISPGTEMTFFGRDATNVYLTKTWDEELRLFVEGAPSLDYPIVFGYRSAGVVDESDDEALPVGTRLFGNWRHTEYTLLSADAARAQLIPDGLADDDAVDLAQMAPICLNAVAYAEGAHAGHPVVVLGAGPVGLITAQAVRATGGGPVFIVDRLGSRLAMAGDLGFEPVDASRLPDVAVELKGRLGSEAIPVVFECTGSTYALNEAIRLVRRRGSVVALGFYQGEGQGLRLGDEFHHNGVQVRCGQIGNLHPNWTWPTLRAAAVRMAMGGGLVLGGLPRLTLPVEQVAAGFDALKRPDEVLQVALSYDSAQQLDVRAAA